jgi:alpha-L-fucosidase 2
LLAFHTLDNLWATHPPFQIDGNFGYAAGVCEMLVQSHMGYIELLPALPSAWPEGYVRGIQARGAFTLDIEWADQKLRQATILSRKGSECRIYAESPLIVTCGGQPVETRKNGNILSFPTKPGKKYQVKAN